MSYIPQATAEKLSGVHPEGTRHKAALDMAISLIGNGIPPDAVFSTLRSKFPADVTDSELRSVVRWAVNKHPTPSGYGQVNAPRPSFSPAFSKPAPPEKTPEEMVDWWTNGATATEADIIKSSQHNIPESRKEMCRLFFEVAFNEGDLLNVICAHIEEGGKARPHGAGKTLSAADWCKWLDTDKVPQSKAGAWIRLNPVNQTGTGTDGAITDADVAKCCYILVESDCIPIEKQLALYARLPVPVGVITMSGGKSAHAWVRVSVESIDEYREISKRLLTLLKPFGIDQPNGNPSRMSRLPGAVRQIGAAGEGLQSLLYLNTAVVGIEMGGLDDLEAALQVPHVDLENPLKPTMRTAMARYQALHENRGKLGVPTGIRAFDSKTGGLHPSQMTVIAAESNRGKTTVALNIAYNAMKAGCGVALFTLEMDRDEICDILISLDGRVDRNVFNTGDFHESDLVKISASSLRLANFPLWIEDDPSIGMAQVEARTTQLAAAGVIKLGIIDYVQLVAPHDERDTREQQVAKISRAIRVLAKRTKIPFIILSQLNEDGKLRESRVIAHEAHNVIYVDADHQTQKVAISIKKGRRIPKEDYVMDYIPRFCAIENTGPQP